MGRKWTQDDVLAYKIKVIYQDLTTFFGMTDLPPPDVASARDALTAQDVATTNDSRTCAMLSHMKRVKDPDNREPATIDFVRELFTLLRYPHVSRKSSMAMRPKLTYMASQGSPPEVDICIMDGSKAIILVVKVDRHSPGFDPEPRLISDAIAAFHNDNIRRVKHLGTNPLISKVMPGIVMDGTMPTFYKIPVTAELVRAVDTQNQRDM